MTREQIREYFTLKSAYSQERLYKAQAEDGSKFMDLEEEQKLNQSFVNNGFCVY